MSFAPFEPPRTVQAPPAGGRIGTSPQHFIVEEIPAYPLSGAGEHLFVCIEKEGLTTPEVVKRIARATSVRDRDVGYAGLKDKHAITRQWFSLCSKDNTPESWDLGEGARVLTSARHLNKLRTGHLLGNRFEITLVDVPPDGLTRAHHICEEISSSGIPNTFGPQRFGYGGRNLARGLEWLGSLTQNASGDATSDRREGSRRGRRGSKNARFDNKMLPSVLQSEMFNRYTVARLALTEELLDGEVVRLEGSKKCFIVEEAATELPRLRSKDIHRTGSLVGPKTIAAQGRPRELEQEIEAQLGLSDAHLVALAQHAPGARRDLLVMPEDLSIEELTPGQLLLRFILPAGSYATELVRAYSGAAWDAPRAAQDSMKD